MNVGELQALCADRPERTTEDFTPNDYYGHATVIKRYCGLPQRFSLPGIHPHGPSTTDQIWEAEVNHPLKHLLLVSETQRAAYAKVCDKPTTAIGSPLYYALGMKEAEIAALRSEAAGTVVFPFHSTHHVTVQYDEERFLDYLKNLPVEAEPITVCMYWRDVQLGRHQHYIDAGFECVSAGHIYDHDFIHRFIRIVASRRRCITNELGTCVFYSAALGLPVTIFRQDYSLSGPAERLVRESSVRPNLPTAQRFLEISRSPTPEEIAEQQEIAGLALGRDDLWDPEKLKAFLKQLDREREKVRSPKGPWSERVSREVARFKRRLRLSA